MQDFVEVATININGTSFTNAGASLVGGILTAYLSKQGMLKDWHGNPLGTYKITNTWRTPKSFVSSTMSQVYATVDGITYTGRSAGIGMVFCGKRVAKQKENG